VIKIWVGHRALNDLLGFVRSHEISPLETGTWVRDFPSAMFILGNGRQQYSKGKNDQASTSKIQSRA
jgi:hypothetical protein